MSAIGIVFRILNGAFMVGIPVAAALLLARRGKGGFRPIWIGALAFFLSQVGHIPFNQFLLFPGLRSAGLDLAAAGGWPLVALGLAAGFSAGVFEEAARYLVFRYWLRWQGDGLLPVKYAVGHGGIEALFVGLLALLALVQVLVLGGAGSLSGLDPEQAQLIQAQLDAYWDVPLGMSLLGAWERVSAMLFHLGASLLVFKSVREKRAIWLAAAVIGHTALDAFAVVGVKVLDLYLLEGLIFLFAVVWVAGAWGLRVRDQDPPASDRPRPLELKKSTTTPSLESLEESRYE